MADLVNEVARAMAEAGVTQAELARRLGISRSAVGQFFHTTNPTLDTAEKYLTALGYDLVVYATEMVYAAE